jgi:type VI secretion system protein ImpL
MKISLEDPVFLTILLVAVVLFALCLIALALYLVWKSRKKGDDSNKEDAETENRKWPIPSAVPGMARSFREAMRRLREKLPGWNHRYEVPWYVLVGESGSGKTTIADSLSGMSAEVVDPDINPTVQYAPRWLLLDKAVLIDLPGRSFLSLEPPPAAAASKLPGFLDRTRVLRSASPDRAAWIKFLHLTARYRPRHPLNGVVLTIPATELLAAAGDPEHPHRLARVADLSQRLDDLRRLLSLSLPVYILVTKCDAITGFGSYSRAVAERSIAKHAGTNGSGHEEISSDLFGWSNPHLLDSAFSPAWIDEAFDATNEVLLRRQLEMLTESKGAEAADGIFLFPYELHRLRTPLQILLNNIFRPTAYHSPHLLRGIYFCGRESADPTLPDAVDGANRPLVPAIFGNCGHPVAYVQHLFEAKLFPERYLATPVRDSFFSRNRSVLAAQIAACVLVVLLCASSIQAWNRIGTLQRARLEPALRAISYSLDGVLVSTGTNVTPAVNLFNNLGAAHENEYYSLAFPYSYLDLDGLHRNLRDTLERSFEIVVLRSCRYALETRISQLVNSNPGAVSTDPKRSLAAYPSGTAWAADPEYRDLRAYLSALDALQTNIERYRLITTAGSGSFKQLNELLHYLGGQNLPDSSRFAQDSSYQKLLLDATWQPLQIMPNYDDLTGAAAKQRIANFYRSWFDMNPLIPEVQTLAGEEGLQGLASAGSTLSNEQLRAFTSKTRSLDNQLADGSYDWVAESFHRESYPALGPQLDEMPFADSQFIDGVGNQGTQKLAGLRNALQTTPEVLDFQDRKTRVDGQVRTLASVLDSLLGYEVMADAYEASAGSAACRLIPAGTIWNQADLGRAIELDAMRGKIESELLPGLPGQYRDVVQRLVDRRTANALSMLLSASAVPNPGEADKQAALQAELANLDQSVDKLKQISGALTELHATAEASCLDRSLVRQANALLISINQQLPALYGHSATADTENKGLPVSLWLYGVSSTDDLQAYLATQRQQIETLSTEAAPLIQLLRIAGGHSDVLNRWRNISLDVEALQAKKAGNPIQTLETFIAVDLDKITPEEGCKGAALHRSSDLFLNVRADLSNSAVARCYSVAVARFNEIASNFNQNLAGHFPFSQLLDTRPGYEAVPANIIEFYQTLDVNSPGLAAVLPNAADKPEDALEFLQAVAAIRPLILGTAKNPNPALGLTVVFRSNRQHEIFGNRIAEWTLRVGQQILHSPPDPGDVPPLIWQLGDPVALTLRYANNSPEFPSPVNPSPAAHIAGATVSYQYGDAWSLFAFFKDHPPGSSDPSNQYSLTVPNVSAASSGNAVAPPDTVVYIQIDVLPVGAKPGGTTLSVPSFPYLAPSAVVKAVHGE